MTDRNEEDCPHCGEDISDVVNGLKSALDKTREEKREEHNKAAVAKDELDKTKVLLEDATLKLKDADTGTADALRTELNAAKEALAATVPKSELEAMTTQLEESRATSTKLQDEATQGKIATAVAKVGGNLAMLSPMIKAKLAENPELDLGEHLATLKNDADFGGAFKASSHSGGGSPPGKGGDGAKLGIASMPMRQSQMSTKQRNEYQKEHGLDALLDLPA